MNQILILLAVCIIGCQAHFQCIYRLNKASSSYGSKVQTTKTSTGEDMPTLKKMLQLQGLLSLEGLCFDMCNNCNGKGKNEHSDELINGLLGGLKGQPTDQGLVGNVLDVAGPLNCVVEQGLKVTRKQACMIMCMANLTILDKCQVQAIVSKLGALCPNLEYKALCVSACLCCGNATKPHDTCVDVCLSRKKGKGTAQLPVIKDLPAGNLLQEGTLAGVAGKDGLPALGLDLGSQGGSAVGGLTGGLGGATGAAGGLGGATGAAGGLGGAAGGLGGATGGGSGGSSGE